MAATLDELLRVALDEASLIRDGIAADELFRRVERRTAAALDDATRALLLGFLRQLPDEVTVGDGDGGKAVVAPTPALWRRAVCVPAIFAPSRTQEETLSAVARGRAEGVAQSDLRGVAGSELNAVHHTCSVLVALRLLTKTACAKHNHRQLTLRRFGLQGPAAQDAALWQQYWRYAWFCEHVAKAPDHTCPESELRKRFMQLRQQQQQQQQQKRGVACTTPRSWKRAVAALCEIPFLSRLRLEGEDGSVSFIVWRIDTKGWKSFLAKNKEKGKPDIEDDEEEEDAAAAATLEHKGAHSMEEGEEKEEDEEEGPDDERTSQQRACVRTEEESLEQQFLRLLGERPEGLLSTEICRMLGLENKVLNRLLKVWIGAYNLQQTAQMVGKSLTYRYRLSTSEEASAADKKAEDVSASPKKPKSKRQLEAIASSSAVPASVPTEETEPEKKKKKKQMPPPPPPSVQDVPVLMDTSSEQAAILPPEQLPHLLEPKPESEPQPVSQASNNDAPRTCSGAPIDVEDADQQKSAAPATAATPHKKFARMEMTDVAKSRIEVVMNLLEREKVAEYSRLMNEFEAALKVKPDKKLVVKLLRKLEEEGRVRLLEKRLLLPNGRLCIANLIALPDTPEDGLEMRQCFARFEKEKKEKAAAMKARLAAAKKSRGSSVAVERLAGQVPLELNRRKRKKKGKERFRDAIDDELSSDDNVDRVRFIRSFWFRVALLHRFFWELAYKNEAVDAAAAAATDAGGEQDSEVPQERQSAHSNAEDSALPDRAVDASEAYNSISFELLSKLLLRPKLPEDDALDFSTPLAKLPERQRKLAFSNACRQRYNKIFAMLCKMGLVYFPGVQTLAQTGQVFVARRFSFQDVSTNPPTPHKFEFVQPSDLDSFWDRLEYASRMVRLVNSEEQLSHNLPIPGIRELEMWSRWRASPNQTTPEQRAVLRAYAPQSDLKPLGLNEAISISKTIGLSVSEIFAQVLHLQHRSKHSKNSCLLKKASRRGIVIPETLQKLLATRSGRYSAEAQPLFAKLAEETKERSRSELLRRGPRRNIFSKEDNRRILIEIVAHLRQKGQHAISDRKRPLPPAVQNELAEKLGKNYKALGKHISLLMGNPANRSLIEKELRSVEEEQQPEIELPATVEEFDRLYTAVPVHSSLSAGFKPKALDRMQLSVPEQTPSLVPVVHSLFVTVAESDDTYCPADGEKVVAKYPEAQITQAQGILFGAQVITKGQLDRRGRASELTARFLEHREGTVFPRDHFEQASRFHASLLRDARIVFTRPPTGGEVWETVNLVDSGFARLSLVHGSGRGGRGAGAGSGGGSAPTPAEQEQFREFRIRTVRRSRALAHISRHGQRLETEVKLVDFPAFERPEQLDLPPIAAHGHPIAPEADMRTALETTGFSSELAHGCVQILDLLRASGESGKTMEELRRVAPDAEECVTVLLSFEMAVRVFDSESVRFVVPECAGHWLLQSPPAGMSVAEAMSVDAVHEHVRPLHPFMTTTGVLDEKALDSTLRRLHSIVLQLPGIEEQRLIEQMPYVPSVTRELLSALEAQSSIRHVTLEPPPPQTTLFSKPSTASIVSDDIPGAVRCYFPVAPFATLS